jgi:hypothetical protein
MMGPKMLSLEIKIQVCVSMYDGSLWFITTLKFLEIMMMTEKRRQKHIYCVRQIQYVFVRDFVGTVCLLTSTVYPEYAHIEID